MKTIMQPNQRRKRLTPERLVACLLCVLWLLLCSVPGAMAQQATAFTLLLIGEDAAGDGANGRSDTMLLVQISPDTGDVKLVSFLRDLYVPVAGYGKTRLNAAYFYGGADLLKSTLKECFGVEIDRTLAVDFAAMAGLIDQVGGVELTLSEEERIELNSVLATYCLDHAIPVDGQLVENSGLVTLSGIQALSYSRIRSLDSDFGRVERQQQVLAAALKALTQMDAFTLMRMAIANMGNVKTDMTLGDVLGLLPLLSREGGLRLRSVRVPFGDTCQDVQANGMWVLDCDMAANTRMLTEFLTAP